MQEECKRSARGSAREAIRKLNHTHRRVDHVLEARTCCEIRHLVGIEVSGVERVGEVRIRKAVCSQLVAILDDQARLVDGGHGAGKRGADKRKRDLRAPLWW